MSDLSSIEQLKVEKLLQMGGGYVLDFSNRTFREFVLENTGIDIYDEKYKYYSGSKANRLRAFWEEESNYLVGKLLAKLLEYWRAQKSLRHEDVSEDEKRLADECRRISEKLKQDSAAEHIEAIQPPCDDKDFSLLKRSIRESVLRAEPEAALDRLHTYTVKYIRQLCDRQGVVYDTDTPLHSLFGGYVKCIRRKGLIESEMSERILKSFISILDSFNKVRNMRSLAHDNPTLNFNESLLIYNTVTTCIRFIESIEEDRSERNHEDEAGIEEDDFPF
jgi:hypothetical protein